MEDVTLFQFTWRKPIRDQGEIVYKTSETQTIETNKKDVECVANFQENKEVQTDSVDNGVGENVKKDITISKEVGY